MRLAWFSPMPPVRSGIAACSAELVEALRLEHEIDVYVDEPVAKLAAGTRSAHEFVWRHGSHPYDLTVYQVGNSSHHDYLWPYLFRYPGLTVLHDVHLHHARAAALLRTNRADDYRAEFTANHPDADPQLAELAVAGFDSHLYYSSPMTRLVIEASRLTAVHAPAMAAEIEDELPRAEVETIRLAHGQRVDEAQARAARTRIRAAYGIGEDAILFGVFGGLAPEKRVPQILAALAAVLPHAPTAHLLLAGSAARHYDAAADVRRHGVQTRVTMTGYLDTDAQLTDCIAACDVSLNLRWPTAREMSGPWLRALAAARPTITTDLAHLADVPSLDPRTWRHNPGSGMRDAGSNVTPGARRSPGGSGTADQRSDRAPQVGLESPDPASRIPHPVTVAIDIMDEDHSLRLAMRRLAADAALRATLGAAAQAHWDREHSMPRMLDDYRRVLNRAAARAAPAVALPAHLVTTGEGVLQRILDPFGIDVPWKLTAKG